MNKFTMSLTALSVVLGAGAYVGAGAYAAEKETYNTETKIERDSDGNYERKTSEESTDVSGTKVKSERKVEVDVDNDGDRETTVETKTSTDPKGLLNKKTTKTKDSTSMKDGKVERKHKRTVNGKTVEDESHSEQ